MISGEHREDTVLRTATKQRCRICILRTNANVRVTINMLNAVVVETVSYVNIIFLTLRFSQLFLV